MDAFQAPWDWRNCIGALPPGERAEANARLIVEAVNAYDALQAVAEAAQTIQADQDKATETGDWEPLNQDAHWEALHLALAELDRVKA